MRVKQLSTVLTPTVFVLSLTACGAGDTTTDAGLRRDVVIAYDSGNFPAHCGNTLGACNLVTSAGCADHQGCFVGRLDGGTIATCAVPSPSAQWGTPCETANGCAPGFACVGSPATCVKLCCADDDAHCADVSHGGRAGGVCAGILTGTDTRLCVQSTTCEPLLLTHNGCGADRPRCDVISPRGATTCAAIHGSGRGDGEACCANTECRVGYVCVGSDTSVCDSSTPNRQCRRACDPTQTTTTTCPQGQGCTVHFVDTPRSFGACASAR